mgnify:CR=1 FL=1
MGLKEEDIGSTWDALNLDKGAVVGLRLHNLCTCPGDTHCILGMQDAMKIAKKLDQTHYGRALPRKFKMAVSGRHLRCSESRVPDIGLIRQKNDRDLAADDNVDANPWIAQPIPAG